MAWMHKKKRFVPFLNSLLLAGSLLIVGFSSNSMAERSRADQGMILVRFKEGVSGAVIEMIGRQQGGHVIAEIPQLRLQMLAVRPDQEQTTMMQLKRHPLVDYVEPNYAVQGIKSPDDPAWGEQWGPARIQAPAAWDIVTGTSDVVIAIVDTGIDLDHPDLQAKVWINEGEIPGNGLDDEGNGKADDVHGWHFYTVHQNLTPMYFENNNVQDDNGHGSHVAGIAAADTNNSVGIAGISWGARLMSVKALDENGDGWYFDVIQSIVYAADNGAHIINLSLGGEEASQALQDAVDYAYRKGTLLVAATGNTGQMVLYPAACEHVLAVAATDADDQCPSFSNYGPEVDVAAPGVNIYSTWPWRDGYWTKSGTSMAAPHVAGLAALIWSLRPDYTNDQVQRCIEQTAVDLGEPGWDEFYGWGRIDAHQSVISLSHIKLYLPLVLRNVTCTWGDCHA